MTRICVRCEYEIRDGQTYQPVAGGGLVHRQLCCRECGGLGSDDVQDPQGGEHEAGCTQQLRRQPGPAE